MKLAEWVAENRRILDMAWMKEMDGQHVSVPYRLRFAKQLLFHRLGRNWGRPELALAARVTVREIGAWEDGYALPVFEQIRRLAWALGGEDAGEVRDYWEYLVLEALEDHKDRNAVPLEVWEHAETWGIREIQEHHLWIKEQQEQAINGLA